jgi:hypothetical protein
MLKRILVVTVGLIAIKSGLMFQLGVVLDCVLTVLGLLLLQLEYETKLVDSKEGEE